VCTGVFLGVRGHVKFTAHFHPVQSFRMGAAITLLPLNAFMVWAGANLPFQIHIHNFKMWQRSNILKEQQLKTAFIKIFRAN